MGMVRMGPPQKIIAELIQNSDMQNFVETGTYYGGTAIWASNLFGKVFTIEKSAELHKDVVSKYGGVNNVEFFLGDSRACLREIVATLNEPTVFWLDAHWSGGLTYGEADQCPLLEELDIINSCQAETYIFIDDARLFLSPPQPPHDVGQWPNIVEVIDSLQTKLRNRYVVITEDCIIAVPLHSKALIVSYCQAVNSEIWENYGKSLKTSDFKKGAILMILAAKARLRMIAGKFNIFREHSTN